MIYSETGANALQLPNKTKIPISQKDRDFSRKLIEN